MLDIQLAVEEVWWDSDAGLRGIYQHKPPNTSKLYYYVYSNAITIIEF